MLEGMQDGQSLIRYGERGEKLYLIRSGQVRRNPWVQHDYSTSKVYNMLIK